MNIVDSSAWLEYLGGTPAGENFSSVIEQTDRLLVPVIVLYEVFKKIIQVKDEPTALKIIASMYQARVVSITDRLALEAVHLGIKYRLPMADSMIYAVTLHTNATLWTQDQHFKDLPNVRYFDKSGQERPSLSQTSQP